VHDLAARTADLKEAGRHLEMKWRPALAAKRFKLRITKAIQSSYADEPSGVLAEKWRPKMRG
jgi:hypothetical protein